jgi:hypothetical protein
MALEIREDPAFPDIAVLYIYDVTTWEDYHRDADDMLRFQAARGRPMDFILAPPPGFPKGNPLPHMRTEYRRMMQATYMRRMVIVDTRTNSLATMLFYILVRLGMIDAKRFFRAPSIEAARELLRTPVLS